MLHKKVIIPSLAIVLLSVCTFGIVRANAQEKVHQSPFQSLTQAISQKFGLKQSDVQSVVDTWQTNQHTQSRKRMQEKLTSKLDGLVKEGKLTAAQKMAILNKYSQMNNNFRQADALGDKTPLERKSAMEQKKSDLKNWATSQGIDPSFLPEILGGELTGISKLRKDVHRVSQAS